MTALNNQSNTLSLDDWKKNNKPLVFKSKAYGIIKLHKSIRFEDLLLLGKYTQDTSIDSREFTIKVIHEIASIEKDHHFEKWNDKTLLMLARKWGNLVLKKENEEIFIRSYDNFRWAVSEYIVYIQSSVYKTIKSFQSNILDFKVIGEQIVTAASYIVKDLAVTINKFTSSLILQFPDFRQLISTVQTSIENAEQIQDILTSSEYELAPMLISSREIIEIKNINYRPALTRRLGLITRSDEFSKEIERLFNTPRLRKRSRVIQQALKAHQKRQYYLSIPVFIAQTEGIFTDLLIIKKLAYKRKNQTITKDKNSKLLSLSRKVDHAQGQFKNNFQKTAVEIVLKRYVNKRNAILHGEKSNYGSFELSTKTLLLLYSFGSFLEAELLEIEKAKIKSNENSN